MMRRESFIIDLPFLILYIFCILTSFFIFQFDFDFMLSLFISILLSFKSNLTPNHHISFYSIMLLTFDLNNNNKKAGIFSTVLLELDYSRHLQQQPCQHLIDVLMQGAGLY